MKTAHLPPAKFKKNLKLDLNIILLISEVDYINNCM